MRFSLLVILLVAVGMAAAQLPVLEQLFESQKSSDNAIFGASVVSQDSTRVYSVTSAAYGLSDTDKNRPMQLDSAVRLNTLSELFVVMAVQKLVDLTFLPSIDAPVPVRYLPRGVQFFNPSFPSNPTTLRQLMQHTSTLNDNKFAQYERSSPTTVGSLASFVEDYFLQSSGGGFTVAADVWNNKQPGSESSYSFARANVALLAYIVEQVVSERPTVVQSTQKTVQAYIQEAVLGPLGMSTTFSRTSDGALPTLLTQPGALYENRAVKDYSSVGALETQVTLHPANVADYMMYISNLDMARLARDLFLNDKGDFKSTGDKLKENSFSVSSDSVDQSGVRRGQVKQGLGVMFFDGALMCSLATAGNIVPSCPLKTTSQIWGYIATGRYSIVGIFCTDEGSALTPTCVTTTHSFNNAGASKKAADVALAMGAGALQQALGETTTVTTPTTGSDDASDLYGLWIFFAVVGCLAFTVLSSYVTEYLVQPAHPHNGVTMPQGYAGNTNIKLDTVSPR